VLENCDDEELSAAAAGADASAATLVRQIDAVPRFLQFLTNHRTFLGILVLNLIVLLFSLKTHDLTTGRISLLVMLAIFAAAMASSVAGFAFSAICGAILFHILTRPVDAVEIMMLCSISIQLLSVITLKNSIRMEHLSRFLIGGALGLPIGVCLLSYIAPMIYLKLMGLFLVVYGAYMLVRRPIVIDRDTVFGDYLAGFFGGVTGGFAAFPGAFVTIWCGLKGWSKDQQRGVYQPFILIMQILALASLYFVQAVHSPKGGLDPWTIAYVPAALMGTWCGIAVYRRLTETQFARLVNVLLVVSGLGLIA
jgi:uncharacterized membrane protein YfcA